MTFSTKQMNIKRNPTVIFENVNRHSRYWKLEQDCKTLKKKQLKNMIRRQELIVKTFSPSYHNVIFASQGLRFGSPFFPPLADLEYILKFARNATWWFIEVAPLR